MPKAALYFCKESESTLAYEIFFPQLIAYSIGCYKYFQTKDGPELVLCIHTVQYSVRVKTLLIYWRDVTCILLTDNLLMLSIRLTPVVCVYQGPWGEELHDPAGDRGGGGGGTEALPHQPSPRWHTPEAFLPFRSLMQNIHAWGP